MNFSKTKSCNKDFSPIGKHNKWKKLWINIKRSKSSDFIQNSVKKYKDKLLKKVVINGK